LTTWAPHAALRRKNLAAFNEIVQKGRIPRLVAYLFDRFPHVFKAGDEDKVRAIALRADASAALYSVTDEDDIALFADLCVMYGDDFHEERWAHDVLRSDKLTSRDKMLELRDRVSRSGALM